MIYSIMDIDDKLFHIVTVGFNPTSTYTKRMGKCNISYNFLVLIRINLNESF